MNVLHYYHRYVAIPIFAVEGLGLKRLFLNFLFIHLFTNWSDRSYSNLWIGVACRSVCLSVWRQHFGKPLRLSLEFALQSAHTIIRGFLFVCLFISLFIYCPEILIKCLLKWNIFYFASYTSIHNMHITFLRWKGFW